MTKIEKIKALLTGLHDAAEKDGNAGALAIVATADILMDEYDKVAAELAEAKQTLLPIATPDGCFCSSTPHEYGSTTVHEFNPDATCPFHGEQAIADRAVLEAADTFRRIVDNPRWNGYFDAWQALIAAVDARRELIAKSSVNGDGQALEHQAAQRSPEGASRVCLHNNKCVGIPRFGSVYCAVHDDLPAVVPPSEVAP